MPNETQSPWQEGGEVFTPSPRRAPFWERARDAIAAVWESVSSRISKKLLITIAAIVAIFLLVYIPLKLYYQPSFPGPVDLTISFKSVVVEYQQVLTRTPDTSVLVVYLRNPNKAYGVTDLKYSYTLYDGEPPAQYSGQTYILPEQDRYLVIPLVVPRPDSFLFALQDYVDDFVRSFGRNLKIELVNVKGENVGGNFVVTGEIINNSPYILRQLEIASLLRAPNQAMRGAMGTLLAGVNPGSVRPFTLSWPTNLPLDTIVDVRAYSNTLSPDNLSLPE